MVIVAIRAIYLVRDIVKVRVPWRALAVMPAMAAVKQNVHQVIDSNVLLTFLYK